MIFFQFFCVSFLILLVNGLYEDQVGDSDWHQQYLGRVSWMSFDSLSGGRRKILMASESGVLAAVNAASGKQAWRHLLEKNGLLAVRHHRSSLVTLSINVNPILRSWDIESGLLKWEVAMDTSLLPTYTATKQLLNNPWRNGVILEMAGNKKDLLVIVCNSVLAVYSTRTGKPLWNTTLPSQGTPLLAVEGSVAKLWLFGEYEVTYLQYDLAKHQAPPITTEEWSTSPIITSSTSSECVLFTRSDTVSMPLCNIDGELYVLENEEFHSLKFKGKSSPPMGTVSLKYGAPVNHVHIGSNVYHLSDDYVLEQLCSDCALSESVSDKKESMKMMVQFDEQEKLFRVKSLTDSVELEVADTQNSSAGIDEMMLMLFHKSDGTLNWRICVVRDDASISLLSQTGSIVWTRHDALGSIAVVEIVDLPSAQFETEAFLALLDSSVNPVTQAFARWRLQASLLQDSLKDIIDRGVASLVEPISTDSLMRDKFNMRKIIVAVTTHSKVYGIDSSDGKLLWGLYIPHLAPLSTSGPNPYILYTIRSSSHPPYPPLMLLMANDPSQCSNGSMLYLFNPLSGELHSDDSTCLPQAIVQSTLLPTYDHTHRRAVAYLDASGVIGCYPRGCGDHVSLHDANLFMYVVNTRTGTLKGYRAVDENTAAIEVWQVVLPINEEILTVVNKNHEGNAHSMGRVRANRDVQYKCLNPNVVGMITKSSDHSLSSKSLLSVYLIDAVNGGIIYRTIHRGASNPADVVICENWMVYHYFSVKSQRNEITVVELYDPRNNTESVWSSLAPPTLPIISTQSYILPTSVVTMTTTTTLKGITPRSLLFGLPTGHILTIRKGFLDPRRDVTASQQMIDEGVPPYVPNIVTTPQSYINYNQTVLWLRGIETSSTGLESTTLVFSYGLDLYVTRVQPSGQFDLLAEDFDYLLVAGVVLVLILATIILSWASKRKTLNALWK